MPYLIFFSVLDHCTIPLKVPILYYPRSEIVILSGRICSFITIQFGLNIYETIAIITEFMLDIYSISSTVSVSFASEKCWL